MKTLATITLAVLISSCSSTPYIKVGTGYKFREADVKWIDNSSNSPLSARIEIGAENGNWSFGYSHHSQWLKGWPIDDSCEYSKHEVFIDYTWRFGNESN